VLSLSSDGLKGKIFERLKSALQPENYARKLRDYLTRHFHTQLANADTLDDAALLAALDLHSALALMLEWREVFQDILAKNGRDHVHALKDLRNHFAHQHPISWEEACAGAESALYLLERFHASREAQQGREILPELRLIGENGGSAAAPVVLTLDAAPAVNGSHAGTALPLLPQEMGLFDELAGLVEGETERLEPVEANEPLYIEIIYQDGSARCENVPVCEERVLIGRGPLRDHRIAIANRRVSRAHLLVTWGGHSLLVTDLRSANGSRLNDAPLPPNQPFPWRVGETITIGGTWLVLRQGG
jgi:hypothetical protein